MARYFPCASVEEFNILNERLLARFITKGNNALKWADQTIVDDTIYIAVDDCVIDALTPEEGEKLVEIPIRLATTSFEAGPILDALMANISQFMTIVQYFTVISPMITWGNFKAINDYLDGLIAAEAITQTDKDNFKTIINIVKPNTNWKSAGATVK